MHADRKKGDKGKNNNKDELDREEEVLIEGYGVRCQGCNRGEKEI